MANNELTATRDRLLDIKNINPWSANLTKEEKAAVLLECRTNPAYFANIVKNKT